jgi:creatinine amidohydrolase
MTRPARTTVADGRARGYWADLTTADFATLDTDAAIAVLPVSAIEQHGPHLPVSVDRDLVEMVIDRMIPLLGQHLSVLVLPTQAVCTSNEHRNFPGTLTLSAETVIRVWMEIGACVARAGIRKLVLLNSHGGNIAPMEIVARDLRADHGMAVAHLSAYAFAGSEELMSAEETAHGIHGGLSETSAMLVARPDLVRLDKARAFPSTSEGWAAAERGFGISGPVRLGWLMDDLNPDGAAGDAGAASAELGETLVANAARGLVRVFEEFSRMSVETLRVDPTR